MNAQKKHGFTLVEVIVTSLIVVILSVIAVPIYLGYVDDTRQNAALGLAETAAAATNSLWQKTGQIPPLNSLNLLYDSSVYTIVINSPKDSVTVTDKKHEISKSVSFK